MSSKTLYPPIVNSYEPAFIAGSSLRVYFSLSALSSIPKSQKLWVHVNILRKDGISVVNLDESKIIDNKHRAAGIILNLSPTKDLSKGENCYYIEITNDDLKSQVTFKSQIISDSQTYNGWIPGWGYKIQLRLSEKEYNSKEDLKQADWLQKNANYFSEWSTFCYTKAISPMILQIPLFGYDTYELDTNPYNEKTIHYINDTNIVGSLFSSIFEANEVYDYVTFDLYQGDRKLESSGELFKTELSDSYFSYNFKTKIEEDVEYKVIFSYITENGYAIPKPLTFLFVLLKGGKDTIDINVVTADTHKEIFDDNDEDYKDYSIDEMEEDAGRVGLKMITKGEQTGRLFSGNLCIRRASAENNFATWEDIKIITLKDEDVDSYPIIYDNTIQSGVWYKYGIQLISTLGERGVLNEMDKPIQRCFNYSFLLGQNGQQLRLQFDNTMSSYKHQLYDSKTDTIGSKYPFIGRNAEVDYKTFPLAGLVTRWMDEDNTFLEKGAKDIYQYQTVIDEYEEYNLKHNIKQYDYTYERDFRQKVIEFLQNGKPKLFKSPTEGNIIVRLMDVSYTPNQSLDRLVYSFSANAHEIDDNTLSNYIKYGFFNPGAYSTDFSVYQTYLGQIDGKFKTTDNIFQLIYNKYDSQGKNYGGYTKSLKTISRLKITFNDEPIRVRNNSGDLVVGNNFRLVNEGTSSYITVYDPKGIYEFDSLLQFSYEGNTSLGNDALYLLGDADGKITEIDATIDFVYTLSSQPYIKHEIKERRSSTGIGQFFEEVKPGTSIYNTIFYKYYMESGNSFRYLNEIVSIDIEANPYTVFAIQDEEDEKLQYHEVGETGVLNLHDLGNIKEIIYVGKRVFAELHNESTLIPDIITKDTIVQDIDGTIIEVKAAADVSLTYRYVVIEGTYNS